MEESKVTNRRLRGGLNISVVLSLAVLLMSGLIGAGGAWVATSMRLGDLVEIHTADANRLQPSAAHGEVEHAVDELQDIHPADTSGNLTHDGQLDTALRELLTENRKILAEYKKLLKQLQEETQQGF